MNLTIGGIKHSEDFSIIIQGPLDRQSLLNLEIYKKYGQVIISHWNSDDKAILDDFNINNCIVTSSDLPFKTYPKDVHGIDLPSPTIYWASHSIHNGLQVCTSKFFIKIRSDERFSNIEPMIKEIRENPKCFVTTSIFFKQWRAGKFHVSDHMFGGDTEIFRNGYKVICDGYDGNTPCEEWMRAAPQWYSEQVHCAGFLNSLGKELTKESVEESFRVVSIDQLGDYVVSYKGAGITWDNISNPWNHQKGTLGPYDSIYSIEDL